MKTKDVAAAARIQLRRHGQRQRLTAALDDDGDGCVLGGIQRGSKVLESADPMTIYRLDQDRKSTRLNSSHRTHSYAVFCLKKKSELRLPARCCLLRLKPRLNKIKTAHRPSCLAIAAG